MTALPLAQRISYDIVVTILRYVTNAFPTYHLGYPSEQITTNSELLAPMAVCRLWRAAACPMFCYQASTYQGVYPKQPDSLDDLVRYNFAEETDHHRSLLISLDISTFLLPPTNQSSPISILRFWRPLRYVLELEIDFHERRCRQITPNGISNISKNIEAFTEHIYTVVPNACRVIITKCVFTGTAATEEIMRLISNNIGAFAHQNTSYLYLNTVALSSAVLDSSGMGDLQYINLICCVNQQPITELVHRNRECLERLHFYDIDYDTLEWLVFGGNRSNDVCVFPRLKYLCADWKDNTVAEHLYKLPLNPFPSLETLNCHELPGPSIAGVLFACRSHLRHLKVEISDDLRRACERLNVFEPGAFKQLHYLNVSMPTESEQSSVALNRFLVITRATVECSLGLQNLILRGIYNDSVCRAFHKLRFPPALRSLTLANAALSVDEALMMFRSCSWLERAEINLDYKIDGIPYEFAWVDCISALRERHQNAVSNLYSLGVRFTTDSHAYNSARMLMLLAELLPDIRRLYITVPDSKKVYDNIAKVLKRPEYKDNARLQSVAIG